MSLLDAVLIATFYLFGFIALVFEPIYYFGCNWQESLCSVSSYRIVHIVGDIWSIYGQWDPLFRNVPLWLRVLCKIEVFIFGPLYVVCAFGLQTRRKWLPYIALPFCGALVYSTIVYFAMEVLDIMPGTNMALVFLVNVPWTIFPIILAFRVMQISNTKQRIE